MAFGSYTSTACWATCTSLWMSRAPDASAQAYAERWPHPRICSNQLITAGERSKVETYLAWAPMPSSFTLPCAGGDDQVQTLLHLILRGTFPELLPLRVGRSDDRLESVRTWSWLSRDPLPAERSP